MKNSGVWALYTSSCPHTNLSLRSLDLNVSTDPTSFWYWVIHLSYWASLTCDFIKFFFCYRNIYKNLNLWHSNLQSHASHCTELDWLVVLCKFLFLVLKHRFFCIYEQERSSEPVSYWSWFSRSSYWSTLIRVFVIT